MHDLSVTFTLIWLAIIGAGVMLYVVLDGFDLGVGILSFAAPGQDERDLMIASVSPFWDGNETWLILAAVGLLAAFPMAFAIVVPALYFPVLMMLSGLIFRGVAFEFRTVPGRHVAWWEWLFGAGSVLAAFAQGTMLGMFIQGFAVTGRVFTGSSFDWIGFFPLLAGLALIAGYALLGACWLILKTEGSLQLWARRMGRIAMLVALAFIVLVSAYLLEHEPTVMNRWVTIPDILFLWPVPLGTALAAWWLWRSLNDTSEMSAFLACVIMFAVSFIGLAISLWPHIVPPSVDLWTAAASPDTQEFLLVGTAVLLPIVLSYTAWSYWVFRGKVSAGMGYGH